MYDDVESDFWKDVFVHMQHKNMVRTNSKPLTISETEEQFISFEKAHPHIKAEVTKAASYVTWEIFLTNTIKLRLYIQNNIKATLLQCTNGDLVKIADAKFFANPFPEIEECIANCKDYEKKLCEQKKENLVNKKQQQLAGEFIKAYVKKHFDSRQEIWELEKTKNEFVLKIEKDAVQKEYSVSIKNFKSELDKIFKEY